MLKRGIATLLSSLLIATSAGIGSVSAQNAKVTVGVNGLVSDAAFYIAEKNGYFKEQNLDVELVSFVSGGAMVAPLSAGQLDIGGGAVSVGLFNAVARGINIRIVADRASTTPTSSYIQLLIRKELSESGKVTSYRDLKGLRIATNGIGTTADSRVNEALIRGGLKYDEAQHVYNMPPPEHLNALKNNAVDAILTTEPIASIIISRGIGTRLCKPDLYPNQVIAALLYGGPFIEHRPDVAKKFMIAYVKAVRFYNDALVDGKFTGPNAKKVVDILVRNTNITDRSMYDVMDGPSVNPDGRVDLDSLRKDFAFFKSQPEFDADKKASVESAVNNTFVENALAVLGPYEPRRTRP